MIKSWIRRFLLAWYSRFDGPDKAKKHRYIKRAYGIEIGRYTYGYQLSLIAKGTRIGAFCSIAPGVSVGLMNHPTGNVSTHPFLYYKSRGFIDRDVPLERRDAVIADDVWLGTNAVIMPGVRIGQGAVVGAGAVVTKDVPPYAVVGGVPARLIRYRFDEDTVKRLSAIRWTDWTDEQIRARAASFYDPAEFLKEWEERA